MKKIIFLALALAFMTNSYGQTILTVKFEQYRKKNTPVQLDAKAIAAIKNANMTIAALNQLPDTEPLKRQLLDSLLTRLAPMDTVPQIKDMLKGFNTKFSGSMAPIDKLDSINMIELGILPSAKSNCSKLDQVVSLKFILSNSEKNSYLGVLSDANDNPLGSFLLNQSNKDLFYDKLKTALTDLCSDGDLVAGIIKNAQKDPGLYMQYLEKKGDLDNVDGIAGTLTIQKNTVLHFKNTVSTNEPVNKIDSLNRTTGQSNAVHQPLEREVSGSKEDIYVYTTSKEQQTVQAQGVNENDKTEKQIEQLHQLSFMDNRDDKMTQQEAGMAENNSSIGTVPVVAVAGTTTLSDTRVNFTIFELQIQFQDGLIENIKVFGKIEGNNSLLRFENSYPIAFSTKRDFRNLIKINLQEKSNYEVNKNYTLCLGDFLSYNQNLMNDNKDYSPANQVLTIKSLAKDKQEVVLYKEQTSRILEARIFSDLKGTDNNNPNGLIQIELEKRLNFLSIRQEITSRFFAGKSKADNICNFGLLNYITPVFSLSKVEDNQKRFIVNHIDTLTFAADTSKPVTYASTINLLKHQVYKVGFDLSVFLLDIPGLKSTFNFGASMYFGRTALQDTLRARENRPASYDNAFFLFKPVASNNVIQYGVNTFQFGGFATWQIFPDARFTVSATQRITSFKALSADFQQVRDSAQFVRYIAQTPKSNISSNGYRYLNYDKAFLTKCIASYEIFACFRLRADENNQSGNKLFFRYRLNWDLNNARENYHQIQVGFSTFITSTKEYAKLKKGNNIFE